jgi:hypothetical protein
MTPIGNEELVEVIKDFLELGHVENIIAMFKQDSKLYELTGDILNDERFIVRMGVTVLFEELVVIRPKEISLAVPSLSLLLKEEAPYLRGDAANILGIIGTPEALELLKSLKSDPEPQVVEIVNEFI